jgi:hypothetical protein
MRRAQRRKRKMARIMAHPLLHIRHIRHLQQKVDRNVCMHAHVAVAIAVCLSYSSVYAPMRDISFGDPCVLMKRMTKDYAY